MKKIIFSLFTVYTLAFIVNPVIINAQNRPREYTLLAPIPGTDSGREDSKGNLTTNFGSYVNGMYRFALGIAGVLAVIMIIFAGFTYMTTDAFQKKQEGRERIETAVLGLLLAIGSWLILNTINPNLLNFDLSISKPIIIVPPQPTGPGGENPQNINSDPTTWSEAEKVARQSLERAGLEAKGVCKDGAVIGCVNLAGLPAITFRKLQELEARCGCELYITGGTEGGHKTHAAGQPVVDLRQDSRLISYVKTGKKIGNATNGDEVWEINGNQYLLESDHVHACMGTACNVQYNN